MLLFLEILIYVFIFALGAVFGSFANVLSIRIPAKQDFVTGRSACPKCGAQIKAYDLIPVLSYIFLGGKCRSCKERISFRYPLVEILTGGLFVVCYLCFGLTLPFVAAAALGLVLMTIALIDRDTSEIPDGLVIALIPLAVLCVFCFPEITLLQRVIGLVTASLPMFLLALAVENAFGGGDIKLMAVAGFILGWQNCLVALFLALLTGGIKGIFLLATRKAGRKETMPFGPYLCFGICTAFLFGSRIIDWYIHLVF